MNATWIFGFLVLALCSAPGFTMDIYIDSGQALGEASCWSVSLQDLDGDDDLDACIDGQFWLNDGNGTFTRGETSLGAGTATFGDLNGDGITDAIRGNRIYLNDRNWHFIEQAQALHADVLGATLMDVDHDGDLDCIAYTAYTDTLWYNDGAGHFTNGGMGLGGWGQSQYATGDINADGFVDIIVSIPHTPPPEMNNDVDDVIWLGSAGGKLTSVPLVSVNFQSRSIIPVDFDRDGDLDLFMGKGFNIAGGGSWCKILLNDGNGNFTDSGQKLNQGYNSPIAKTADLDNDGDVDIFICNGMPTDNGQPNTVWLNDGNGHFFDAGVTLGQGNSLALALGDIDGDGDVDALTANVNLDTGKASARVYLNTCNIPPGLETGEKIRPFHLDKKYSIPFNPFTTIRYTLHKPASIDLQVYNIGGRLVKSLNNATLPAGEYSVIWDGRDANGMQVSSGVNFCQLTAQDDFIQKKMVLIK